MKAVLNALVLLVIPAIALAHTAPWQAPAGRTGTPAPAGVVIGQTTIGDPTGDTFGTGAVQHDITSFTALSDGVFLVLELQFAGPITAPGTGQPTDIIGYFDLDLDQNSATGSTGIVDEFTPHAPTGLGVEAVVSFNPEGVMVLDPVHGPIGTGSAVYGASSVTVLVPLSTLGDEGFVNAAAIVGTYSEPTDVAPNGGSIASSGEPRASIPVLSPAGLAGAVGLIALLGVLALWRRLS
jgi:hypothetical protein